MNPMCKQCGQCEVEDARKDYATPVCFACLPQPRALNTAWSLPAEWLADMAEVLEHVRHEDGAPLTLTPKLLLGLVNELREDRDDFKRRAEAAEFSLSVCREHAQRTEEQLNAALSGEADAVRRAESAELGCEIAYRREPTQAEGDAHCLDRSSTAIQECHVPMGNHHGHRCSCGRWVWGGPTICQRCVDASSIKIASEWKAEADRLRKLVDAGECRTCGYAPCACDQQ